MTTQITREKSTAPSGGLLFSIKSKDSFIDAISQDLFI